MQRPARKLPCDDTRLDVHADFELAVLGMKVGRRVLAVVHAGHDSEKAAELGHRLHVTVQLLFRLTWKKSGLAVSNVVLKQTVRQKGVSEQLGGHGLNRAGDEGPEA